MTQSINSATYKEFRKRLVKHRRDIGLSQTELAERLGKPQQFVSRYELGERRIDVGEFLEIAEHLGIDAAKMIKDLDTWRKKNGSAS